MPMLFGRPEPHEDYKPAQDARELIAKTVANLGLEPSDVEELVPVGSPGKSLVDLSEDAHLLVVGRRNGRPVSHLLLGSTSTYCLRHSSVSVVVVPPADEQWTRIPEGPPRVVVGVDGSSPSISALRWAAQYARGSEAKLSVVSVWEWPLAYGYPTIPPDYAPDVDARTFAERAVGEVDLPADAVEIKIVEGPIGTELVRMSHAADLLVVGSHGHGAVGSKLLGSISSYCVQHATVPIAVIKTGL